jgi:predicted TIM-barrel fold metal-dependent hydrolase
MFRMDTLYERHHSWVLAAGLSRPPSEYFRDNVYLTFQDDRIAFQVLDLMNPDRLMWANDHPHSDATWPNSEQILNDNLVGVSTGRRDGIVRDNCAALYGLAT